MQLNGVYYGWIYCIVNLTNNKKYIGQTSDQGGYEVRWDKHKRLLRSNNHVGRNGKADHLQNAWNKYGEENFEFILLHELTFNNEEELIKELNRLEVYYIKEWNLLNRNLGYNISSGGSSGNNFAGKSEEEMNEIKQKMSEKRKGKNNPFYGKHHTEETKRKISEYNKGRYEGKKNPFYGKAHSEEVRKKISEHNKGRKNYSRAKAVAMIDIETNEVLMTFDSMADANEYLGKPRDASSIRACARGKYKTAFGYKWKYL